MGGEGGGEGGEGRGATQGPKGLYPGIIPAIAGAAMSHGLRTASYEGTKQLLAPLEKLPGVSEVQIQGFASGVGTVLGTGFRIPCEVLKQQLQCGLHPNAVAALAAVLKQEGMRGMFRGTSATLGREVPFYVIGIVAYEQLKKVTKEVKKGIGKSDCLSSWETLLVGTLSGAIAAALTTPADVLKTRMMTGAVPASFGVIQVAQMISKKEGALALFKGALPRAVWVAPLGAMNFAGYELAKRALDGENEGFAAEGASEEDVEYKPPNTPSSLGVPPEPAAITGDANYQRAAASALAESAPQT
ncbi:hypothetical protein CYMTET_39630 [Cymbomonas tetramitiformis]|uniref:Mitochondrial substrate carrier family protein n=1 Tax=Cymbomonas tetramitiformis TaxID=36881 RepID=A0AAE0F4A9_9CHLO|nr:hypothetical protein CYMTET_39630 [Cymbomonas tetramitiformis]